MGDRSKDGVPTQATYIEHPYAQNKLAVTVTAIKEKGLKLDQFLNSAKHSTYNYPNYF
jgi:hypothetical protein